MDTLRDMSNNDSYEEILKKLESGGSSSFDQKQPHEAQNVPNRAGQSYHQQAYR